MSPITDTYIYLLTSDFSSLFAVHITFPTVFVIYFIPRIKVNDEQLAQTKPFKHLLCVAAP